jgi:hypothetical protein
MTMASTIDRESLAAELERHMAEEGEILREYRALSDKLAEGPVSFLIDRIVTDEEMHHFLLHTLSDWLRTPPTPGESPAAQGVDRDAILRHTRLLKEHEKQTIKDCRDLISRLSGEEGELFETLLDAVALDSEKHHRLLSAVEKLLA